MELFDLKGKVALVTGSTKGIGKAIVTRMAEHGAKVVVSSRKADACDAVAAEINEKYPGQAIAVPCNIADKEQLQNLVDKTNEAFGKIDVLVCNAAVNPYFGPSKDIPDEAFDRIMASNVKSNHWLAHMVLPQMKERKDGSIIIISSIGGLHGSPIIGAYCISKAADFQLARNLSVEYGADNVRVNCIAPGLIQTYFAKALWDNPDILEKSTASAPLKRIGQPDEIAGAAVFLASKAGAFMTGQQMVIDGGVMIS
ncbi:SDR family NAD(P)-dependent oxidoreductase [Tepidicaulis sp. LMO-SS28]|uniref:SDR family NAD(P)-dependent oxidoreductase n=1 Tax=Tepidicaulis sp. LMO-SS28 TaxID=3447455 RepID=UPI003EDF2358